MKVPAWRLSRPRGKRAIERVCVRAANQKVASEQAASLLVADCQISMVDTIIL